MEETRGFREELAYQIQDQLGACIGEEEAETLQKKTPGISAAMRRVDGIAASVVQRAMSGDMSAVRFIFQRAEDRGNVPEIGKAEPFEVGFTVVDEF